MCISFFGGNQGKSIVFIRIGNKNLITKEGYYLIDETASDQSEIGNLYKMYYDVLSKKKQIVLIANIRGIKGLKGPDAT